MKRRAFLKLSAALPALSVASHVPGLVSAAAAQARPFDPRPGTWRTYEVATRVELLEPAGVSRVWVPLSVVESEYQKPLGNRWSGNAKVNEQLTERRYGASTLYAEFAADERAPRPPSPRWRARRRASG